MTLDQAIQNTIFKSCDRTIEDIAYVARKDRDNTIEDYKAIYGWSYAECEEYLENVELAYELLVKEAS